MKSKSLIYHMLVKSAYKKKLFADQRFFWPNAGKTKAEFLCSIKKAIEKVTSKVIKESVG